MKTGELIHYGLPQNIITVWEEAGIKSLLPIQALAVRKFDLFGRKNLIVSAPTSSGKTFVGELAAVKNAVDKKKAFYLAPLKAIAEEKYRDFKLKYEKHGIRVVVSTRDRREHDADIEAGDFGIAVVVYEKLQQLLTQNMGLLDRVGLVVIDEMQMLSDESRGADLELLLTKIKMYRGEFKILGLSAVLKNCDIIPKWLNADFLEYPQRPVELRRGVLYKGVYHYETFNTCESGKENMIDVPQGNTLDITIANIVPLAKKGEQCLIFLKDKNSTRATAEAISTRAQLPPAAEAVAELSHIEDTNSKFQLLECLGHGVAFHNADMNIEEREVVERHFRAGKIAVLCSTSTLAMGVNMPARNVFIEADKWHTNRRFNRPYKRAITKSEFENMGGRAGRLSLEKEFGRAVVVADSEIEFIACTRKYIEGEIEELETHLLDADLGTVVLNLVASNICGTAREVKEFIRHSLSWHKNRHAEAGEVEELNQKIDIEVKNCIEYGLFEGNGAKICASKLGRACAGKGISVESSFEIISWLNRSKSRATGDLEAIYVAAGTKDAQDYHINMSTREYREAGYHAQLERELDAHARKLFARDLYEPIYRTYEKVKAMKITLVMNEWISGTPLIEIEERFNSFSGAIQKVAEGINWIVDAVAGIASAMDVEETKIKQYERLSRRLLHGIQPQGFSFAELRVRGLSRHQITKLMEAGITNVDKLKERSLDELAEIIPAKLAKRLMRRLVGVTSAMTPQSHKKASPLPAPREISGSQRSIEKPAVSKEDGLRDDAVPRSFKQVSQIPFRELVGKIAKSDGTALITGETGVGKEFWARRISEGGEYSRVFKAYNCSGKNELIESELFGYKKGAFTGAVRDTTGLIESAAGGTLFLDEIMEMPPEAQAKLLRFLQDKSIRPLGGDEEVRIDVRVIAATNENIDAAVRDGKFREDLFHRLNVLRLHIPPLRDRKREIPALGNAFLRSELGPNYRNKKRIPARVYEPLKEYDWPGNVRELENAIKRAIALSRGRELSYSDIIGTKG